MDLRDEKAQRNQSTQEIGKAARVPFKSGFVDLRPIKAKLAAKQRWRAMQPTAEPASPVCYLDELIPQPDLETCMNLAAMQVISGQSAEQLNRLKTAQPGQYMALYARAERVPMTLKLIRCGH